MRGCWTSTTAVATTIVSATKKKMDDVRTEAAAEAAAVADGSGGTSTTSSPPLTVLEIDRLHCWGCAKKVRKLMMDYPGVTELTKDIPANRVMVTGAFDAECLALSVRVRSKKAVTIVRAPGRAGEALTADVPSLARTEER